MRFPATADARVTFHADPGDSGGFRAEAFVAAGPFGLAGSSFDRGTAALRWSDGSLSIIGFEAGADDPPLKVRGNGSYTNGALRVDNLRVVTADVRAVLTKPLKDRIRKAEMTLGGELVADIELGPAPMDTLLETVSGRLECESVGWRGAALQQVALSFERQGDVLLVRGLQGALGGGATNDELAVNASGRLMLKAGQLHSELRVQGRPVLLAAPGLLPTNLIETAATIGPVTADIRLSGSIREPSTLGIAFRVVGEEDGLPATGVAVQHAYGSCSNGVLNVRSLRVSADDVDAFLPSRLRDRLSKGGVDLKGPFHADLALGPSAATSVLERVTGRLTCSSAVWRGVPFERPETMFRRDGGRLSEFEATAVVPVEGKACTLSARGVADLDDNSYAIRMQTDAPLDQIASVLPTNVAEQVRSFDVRGDTDSVASLSGTLSDTGQVAVSVAVHASDVVRHGVSAALVHASLTYSNGALRAEDVAMALEDGLVTGSIGYDTVSRQLVLDVRSTAPPAVVARFVGPGLENVLAPYRLEGPATIDCRGTLGLGDIHTRSLRVQVKGEKTGWQQFVADRAKLELLLTDDAAVVDKLSAAWCGGQVSGTLRWDRSSSTNEPGLCGMDLVLDGAELARVAAVFVDMEDKKAYEGTLSGQLSLSGAAGTNFLRTATGTGRVAVEDGFVLGIPIFGGLSKYLALLVPGLGYANQRDFRSTFQVRNGGLETGDAELLGRLITIRGKGSYAFNKDLNFRIQVQFLKEGLTATVTRLLTSPLTKALEFELTGTTKQPRWRPVNTPDRLLRFFAGNLGKLVPAGNVEGKDVSPRDTQTPRE